MDSVRLGRQVRALRRRRRWRQSDPADAARVSRSTISLIELGHGDRLTVATIERVVAPLSARLDVRLSWNGEALDRLLDADHAALVELVARRLRSLGWDVAVEVSFSIAGERGSVDVLGFHPPTRALVVVEVKSVVPDLQATVATHDRKTRLAPRIAAERGWPAAGRSSRLLAVGESRTARRRVETYRVTFDAVYPLRGWAVDRWLRAPDPALPLAGLLFLSGANHAVARHRVRAKNDDAERASHTTSTRNSAGRQPREHSTGTR